MKSLRIHKELLSGRYSNDNVSLLPLDEVQREGIRRLMADSRMRFEERGECPLCGHTEAILIAEKERYGLPLPTGVCVSCGLVFTLAPMSEESARIFYSEYYRTIYEGKSGQRTEDHFLYARKRSSRIPRFLTRASVIVEIGAGGGWNLLEFHKQGFNVQGFDYDSTLVTEGRKRFGLNLHVGSVEDAVRLGIKADYVILSHVLEHVHSPIDFLKRIRAIVKDGAIINISVPSLNYLVVGGGATGFDLLGTLQNAHNFLFDEVTLGRLAMKAGFGICALYGGNLLAVASLEDSPPSKELPEEARGQRVVRYLRFCESLVPIKNTLIPRRFELHLHYLYYFFRIRQVSRKYSLLRSKGYGSPLKHNVRLD